jgi:hypothetical protein
VTILVKPTPSTNCPRGWIPGVHRGIDWGWQYYDPEYTMQILAAAEGIVVYAYDGDGMNEGWGRRIKINHAPGVETAYNHMRPGGVLVRVGQRVKAGQLIGRMGSSGTSKGTHLHFELYLNGWRVDPAPYFTKHIPGTPLPAGDGSKPLPLPQPRPTTDPAILLKELAMRFIYVRGTDNGAIYQVDLETGRSRHLGRAEWSNIQGAYIKLGLKDPLVTGKNTREELLRTFPLEDAA